MNIIEQAAQRLEALRRAGVDAPDRIEPVDASRHPTEAADRTPTPERLLEALQSDQRATPPLSSPPSVKEVPTQRAAAPDDAGESSRRSRLVEIDLVALAAAGFLTPDGQRSQLADEFRVIKRPIIKNAQGKAAGTIERGNRVMVTSALPGEGKSFVALNLAMSIALEVDSTVLLVDADVANPSLMATMRLPRSKGLLDLLNKDGVDLSDVLLRTNVDKLTFLPAGTAHPRATEMLASSAMAELVDEMAARYPDRILVFDSPPLLATTEARVLATLMGQIVMVVEADRTTQAAVTEALETVESCPIVLMTLNKAPRSEVGGYYGYGAYGAST